MKLSRAEFDARGRAREGCHAQWICHARAELLKRPHKCSRVDRDYQSPPAAAQPTDHQLAPLRSGEVAAGPSHPRFRLDRTPSMTGTNRRVARCGDSRPPTSPRARSVIQGVVDNGYALVFSAFSSRVTSLHCRFHIAGLDEFPFLLRVMRPHAGQAIGLQLNLDLQMISRPAVAFRLESPRFRQDAKQVLDVMPDLMSDHVCLRKLTGFAAAAVGARLQVLEKRRVQVNVLIVRAIERPHHRLREAASRGVGAGE